MNRPASVSKCRRRKSAIRLWSGCWWLMAGQHSEHPVLPAGLLDLRLRPAKWFKSLGSVVVLAGMAILMSGARRVRPGVILDTAARTN